MSRRRAFSSKWRGLSPGGRSAPSHGSPPVFSERVYALTRQIPKGRVSTYGALARAAGSPLAVRAVGNILHRNSDWGTPCHRVVCFDGRLGGYASGSRKKKSLLVSEGIEVRGKRLDLDRYAVSFPVS